MRRTEKTMRDRLSRRLRLEQLETRTLLAADWQNPVNRLDVDASGQVTVMDALLVINELIEHGSRRLITEGSNAAPPPYVDVNGNDFVEPLDALLVINELNSEPLTEDVFVQRFLVNVATNEVSIAPQYRDATGAEGESLFAGSTILFNSTPLLDQPGDTGRKLIRVSLTNRSGEMIGQLPNGTVTGLRALFSEFKTIGTATDPATQSSVSTFAGSGVAGSTDGPLGSASFNGPSGVAIDSEGNVYVADYVNNKIRKMSNGIVSTLAGSGAVGGVDGSGQAASFSLPFGIAVNPLDGALFVTDFSGQRIRRVTPDGEVTTIAGTGSLGDTNGKGDVAMFRNPAGIAIGDDGTIYVAEANGHRIRRIQLTGTDPRTAASYNVSIFAGSSASPPVAGSVDAVWSAARFNTPRGVAVDADGVVYVADTVNARIRRISSNREVVTIAGTGAVGLTNGPGNVATFNDPQGIAVVPGTNTLLVSNRAGQAIRQLTLADGASPGSSASWQVHTIAGTGTPGATNGPGNVATFRAPVGMAVDASRNVYIADFTNSLIRLLTPTNGRFPLGVKPGPASSNVVQLANADGVFPIANPALGPPPIRTGEMKFIKYDEALAPGETTASKNWGFIVPSDVTMFEFTVTVAADTAFLAPPFAVVNPGPTGVGSPQNMVRTIAGRGLGGHVDGLAFEARFTGANQIAADRFGNLFVADSGNHAIRRISSDGRVSTIAGVSGMGSGSTDGIGTVARFNSPQGVAVSPDGQTVYVADTSNHTIRRISLVPFSDPTKPTNWLVTTIAGLAATSGLTDNSFGNGARLNSPSGVALSEGGVVYISEQGTHRIRRLHPTGGDPQSSTSWFVTTLAGSTAGISGNTEGNGTTARFSSPRQLAVDRAGNVYVADLSNFRVRKITPDGDVSTLAGSSLGYADGQGTTAQFGSLYSITVDSAGYVYVGDDRHRIRRISPDGLVATVAGGNNYGDREGTGDVAEFYYPTGIAVDEAGSLTVVTGGQYPFDGGGSVTSPGLRIRRIERIISVGRR